MPKRLFGLNALNLAVLFFLAITSGPAFAQTAATGALKGTIADPSGAVVPNTTITVTSLDTGQVRTATTGSDGSYTIGLLPPGDYRLKFEATGFKPVEIPSAHINVTETAVLDRALDVGTQTQTVTVEGEVETIQTANSALGTVMSTSAITSLPLNTRNYTNLLTLSAGANASVTNASFTGKGSTLIAVNGGGTAQNTYLQDGVPINNWFSFNTGAEGVEFGSFAIPIPDAIQEFKIQTSTYDAGYGRNPGANVNVITKSGTNNYHGSAFEFFRNSALNANDWIRNFQGLQKPVLNSNQFGGVFGGPIKKDKIFFFVSYQETRQKNGIVGYGSSTATLPPIPLANRGTCPKGFTDPSQCDAAAQAFIPALAAAVCPAAHAGVTADTAQAGTVNVQCPGSAGANSLFNINPVAISILQTQLPGGGYMIPGSGSANYTTTTFSDPARFSDHNGMGNLDYVINSKHTLSGRYSYEQDPTNSPFPTLNITLIGNTLPGYPVVTTKWNHAALLKLTSILTNNLVNEARIAFQRNVTIDNYSNQFSDSQFGIVPLNPGYDHLSYFTVGAGSGGFSFGPHYFFDGVFPENQFEWSDQISWTHGKHTFRTGFEAERIQLSRSYPGNQAGNPTFPRFADFLIGRCANVAGCANSNGGTASNLTGTGNFTAPTASFGYLIRATDLNGFIQDDYKVNSRLTLNLGVRWEYDGLPYLKDGNFSNFWPNLANASPLPGSTPQTGSLAGFIVPSNYGGPLPAGLFQSNKDCATERCAPWNNFAPRVGFAWQPLASNRWVVRGGAGYFYDIIGGQIFADGNPGVTAPGSVSPITPPSTATLANPWVLPSVILPGPSGTYGFPPRWVNTTTFANSGISQTAVQQDLKTPLTYEWNLNTQYEFKRNWVLELGYVGSHGIHQVGQSRSGAQGQGTTVQGFNLAPLAGAGCSSCALTGVTTNTVANVVLRVPYLGISPTDSMIASTAAYKYNSLQATVRKQLSYGLQLQGSYTWSRAFIALPFFTNTAPYQAIAYEPNNNYRPQRFVLNYVWNLPLPHPQGWLGRVAEGWSASGVTTIQNGTPLTITDGTGGSIFFGGQGANSTAQICPGMSYSNLLTSGSLTQRVGNGLVPGGTGYLNGKAQNVLCAVPAIGNGTGFGNMGGGAVLGPGQNNWDISLAKITAIRESQSVQFRAEFFDVWNHPQFSNPVTVASAPNFGQISTTSVSPRIIQLALKYSF
jgi:hypothetical protein